jgi:hypothetical protein
VTISIKIIILQSAQKIAMEIRKDFELIHYFIASVVAFDVDD